MPSNLTWPEARDLAAAGQRVRRFAWETEWITASIALWFIGETDGVQRVIQAGDLTSADLIARDWTTEPYEEPDPCDRPPPVSTFDPPGISLSAKISGLDLDLRAVLGGGTYGTYRLYFFVNGSYVGGAMPTAAGEHTLSVAMDPEDLVAAVVVEVRVYSVPPLPMWLGQASASIPIPACELCSSGTLPAWLSLHSFPSADSGALPYSLDGSSVAGTTIHGDITSDGTSFGRSGTGDLGGGLAGDTSIIVFPIVARDFTFSYEYQISAGGKHSVSCRADTTLAAAIISIGSWSSNFSNTIGQIGAGVNQLLTACQYEYPPAELSGVLPQTSGVWRTRTIVKSGDTITFSDGAAGPIPLTRCFFPTRGHLALVLGPGVRIKNLSISAL